MITYIPKVLTNSTENYDNHKLDVLPVLLGC